MYMIDIDNTITQQPFDGLQIEQLVKNPSLEILSISLAKNAVFPNHTSPKDAHLITAQQHFGFSKEVEHWVTAKEDTKFLIIR